MLICKFAKRSLINANIHQMGLNAHVLTFPVSHGKILNLVAFRTNPDDWPDYNKLVRPATREQALKDFKDFGPSVIALLNLCPPNLDCVSPISF